MSSRKKNNPAIRVEGHVDEFRLHGAELEGWTPFVDADSIGRLDARNNRQSPSQDGESYAEVPYMQIGTNRFFDTKLGSGPPPQGQGRARATPQERPPQERSKVKSMALIPELHWKRDAS
jgi:hypothetical protein